MSSTRKHWAEIGFAVLRPDERPNTLPPETRSVPYYARVSGFVTGEPAVGDTVEIETSLGRTLRGELLQIDPAYSHGFGLPVLELIEAGLEARLLLWDKEDGSE